jgi:hypothetical protein
MSEKTEKRMTKISIKEAMKCGQCLHFKQTAHKNFDAPCQKNGVRAFAIAPPCYTPDYTKAFDNTDEFVQLSALFASKTPEQKKILLGMLRATPKGRKLKMGTCLYLNLRGREYISNYVRCYVVGYTSAGQIVLTGSPDRKVRGKTFFAYLDSDDSLIEPKVWRARMSKLKTQGRIQDPTTTKLRNITASVENDTYEIPTIDNAPKDSKVKVQKIKRTDDLVKIMSI